MKKWSLDKIGTSTIKIPFTEKRSLSLLFPIIPKTFDPKETWIA